MQRRLLLALPLVLLFLLGTAVEAFQGPDRSPKTYDTPDGRWRVIFVPTLYQSSWRTLRSRPDAFDRDWSENGRNVPRIGLYARRGESLELRWARRVEEGAGIHPRHIAVNAAGAVFTAWDDAFDLLENRATIVYPVGSTPREDPQMPPDQEDYDAIVCYHARGRIGQSWSREDLLRAAGLHERHPLLLEALWLEPGSGQPWLALQGGPTLRLDGSSIMMATPEDTAACMDRVAPWLPLCVVETRNPPELSREALRRTVAEEQLAMAIRLEAARVLALRGDEFGTSLLLWAAETPRPSGILPADRTRAVECLIQALGVEGLELAEPALREEDVASWKTHRVIADLGPEAVPVLRRFLEAPDAPPGLRSTVQAALRRLGVPVD